MKLKVYCWQSGHLEFGTAAPEGTITIATVRNKAERAKVEVCCRHSRHNDDLLIPGIPEAESEEAAIDALVIFCQQLRQRGIETNWLITDEADAA